MLKVIEHQFNKPGAFTTDNPGTMGPNNSGENPEQENEQSSTEDKMNSKLVPFQKRMSLGIGYAVHG